MCLSSAGGTIVKPAYSSEMQALTSWDPTTPTRSNRVSGSATYMRGRVTDGKRVRNSSRPPLSRPSAGSARSIRSPWKPWPTLLLYTRCPWGEWIGPPLWCLKAVRPPGKRWERGHYLTLKFMGLSAFLLARQGSEEAQVRAMEALEACQRTLGNEHPVTLQAKYALGSIYSMQMEFDKAYPLLSEALPTVQRSLGDDSAAALAIACAYAGVCKFLGRCQEAEQLYAKVIEDERRIIFKDP
ncbi:MAG: tetratricopeptide repeat protein, partial [Planctomycetaceae bacterium]